jgi:hypothetical protein
MSTQQQPPLPDALMQSIVNQTRVKPAQPTPTTTIMHQPVINVEAPPQRKPSSEFEFMQDIAEPGVGFSPVSHHNDDGQEEDGDDEGGGGYEIEDEGEDEVQSQLSSIRPRSERRHRSERHDRHRHERDIRRNVHEYSKFKREVHLEDEQAEKLELLNRIQQLKTDNIMPYKHFTQMHDLDELRYEVFRMQREFEKAKSIQWMQQGLITGIRMIEMANAKWNFFGLELEGFSRVIASDIDTYKPSLLGIHARYGSSKSHVANPVVQLVLTLLGSLLFNHISMVQQKEAMGKANRVRNADKVIRSLAGDSAMQGPPSDSEDSDEDSGV